MADGATRAGANLTRLAALSAAPWDVAILGGGPAGAAAALSLRRRGVGRVLVVEAGDYTVPRIGESVPPDIRVLLERELGLWQAFLAEQHEPCFGSCSSWGGAALGYNDFLCNPHGHGWHLNRTRFDAFLAQKAGECGATVLCNTRFKACAPLDGGGHLLRVRSAQGEEAHFVARFVIDATGTGGRFARLQGARMQTLDRLVFAAGFFTLPDGSTLRRLTMLEAVEEGWWYAARLPEQRCIVAFACDSEELRRAGLMRAEAWLERLAQTRHIYPALAGAERHGQDVMLAVAVSFLRAPVGGQDWLAVGDAASGYDPLSSQGIQKAILDGVEAAAAISEALASGAPLGAAYGEAVSARFDEYSANRKYFYAQETRWRDAPFWRNRRARSALRATAG